jgi:hypothetical protein
MAIEGNGRFAPNATKGALELFSNTDVARALTKLNCGLTREQVAQIASAYEQLFTPESVRRSKQGLVRERLMRKVQSVFPSTRHAQVVATACERFYDGVLDVKDGDWSGLYVQLAIALGMDPAASECAHAVVRFRREQGKKGEEAVFASEQFNEMWSPSDRAALDNSREFESIVRDVVKTCIAVAQKGVLDGFKSGDQAQLRELSKLRRPQWTSKRTGQRQSAVGA